MRFKERDENLSGLYKTVRGSDMVSSHLPLGQVQFSVLDTDL